MGKILGLAVLIADIIAIVDLLKGNRETSKKILWILFILLAPLVGVVCYFLLAKGKA